MPAKQRHVKEGRFSLHLIIKGRAIATSFKRMRKLFTLFLCLLNILDKTVKATPTGHKEMHKSPIKTHNYQENENKYKILKLIKLIKVNKI